MLINSNYDVAVGGNTILRKLERVLIPIIAVLLVLMVFIFRDQFIYFAQSPNGLLISLVSAILSIIIPVISYFKLFNYLGSEGLNKKKKPKVFLSYAHEDIADANRLYNDLTNSGVSAWMANESLLPGQNWPKEIRRTIRNSQYFLAIISKNSVNKNGFFNREIDEALNQFDEPSKSDIFIIPVRLDESQPANEMLCNLQWVDMFPSWESGLSKIISVIRIQEHPSGLMDSIIKKLNLLNHINIINSKKDLIWFPIIIFAMILGGILIIQNINVYNEGPYIHIQEGGVNSKIYNNTIYVNASHYDLQNFIYPTINAAIQASKPGGMVVIEKGTYNESININKSLKLLGIQSTIDGGINIQTDNVSIQGFIIKSDETGIRAQAINHLHIAHNEILGKFGLQLDNLSDISLDNNSIKFSDIGICIYNSSGSIINNIVDGDTGQKARYSILMKKCDNLKISKNLFKNSQIGIASFDPLVNTYEYERTNLFYNNIYKFYFIAKK
jgi:hypothetical protein